MDGGKYNGRRFASPDISYEALQEADPTKVLRWAGGTIDRLAVASSFQASGLVILHMLKDIRPDLPVLFTTGYTRNAIVHQGRLDRDVDLLNKPYTAQDLARKIRELLDRA